MPVEDFIYTAIKIENINRTNQTIGRGSGFFFKFNIKDTDVLCVITNKHVIDNSDVISLHMPLANDAGERIFRPAEIVNIELNSYPIFQHPDENVDLAAIPIAPVVAELLKQGQKPFTLALSKNNFAPPWLVRKLEASTNIVMVGYPDGIMDTANNLPIARSGSLATPYRADYNGEKNFVIDIAALPGSSGSAVFAFFDGNVPLEGGVGLGEKHVYFLGVLHSGPQISACGEIRQVIPTNTFFSETKLMMHLGYCAKAALINDLEPSIAEYLSKQTK